jgi:hypothetical protein
VFPIGRIEIGPFTGAAIALQTNVHILPAADTGDYAAGLQIACNGLIPKKKSAAQNGMQLAFRSMKSRD